MSLGALATPLLIASTAIGIGSTIIQTSSAINQANYQQQVALRQQQIDEDNAVRAEQTAQVAQQDQDRQTSAAIGAALAQQGASGLSVNGGSQLLTRKSLAQLGRRDALNVRQAGDISAYNYKTEGQDAGAEAQFAATQAQSDLLSGFLGVGSSIIGGAGKYLNNQGLLGGTKTYGTTAVPAAVMF